MGEIEEEARRNRVRANCTASLSFHGRAVDSPRRALEAMLAATPEDELADNYGEGGALQKFEAEIAALLGKEAAVFMPSGTMAQQIAMRIAADRVGSKVIAFHPR